MMNNRAQVGATITWVVAFIIIFFIMALFISATMVISARKRVSYGSSEIDLGIQVSEIDFQRGLDILFNYLYLVGDEKLDFNELIIFSVNKYGDRTDAFSSGGHNVREGYDELKQGVRELFEISDIYWDIKIYDKQGYDNPEGGIVSATNWGEYYFFKRAEGECNVDKAKMEYVLKNNQQPEEILVIVEICNLDKINEIVLPGVAP